MTIPSTVVQRPDIHQTVRDGDTGRARVLADAFGCSSSA